MKKCGECGGTKDAYNQKKEEWVCNNRSCSQSPMNNYLTFTGEKVRKGLT